MIDIKPWALLALLISSFVIGGVITVWVIMPIIYRVQDWLEMRRYYDRKGNWRF